PAASKINTILVTAPVEIAIRYISAILMDLKITSSSNNAYNTENAAASVGLNIPEQIPPRISTGNPNVKNDFLKDRQRWRHVAFGSTGISLFIAMKNSQIANPKKIINPGIIPAINKSPTDVPVNIP